MTNREYLNEMRRLYKKPESEWNDQDWQDYEFACQSYEDWQSICDDNEWEERR